MSALRDVLQLLLILGAGAMCIRFFNIVLPPAADTDGTAHGGREACSNSFVGSRHTRRRSSGMVDIPGSFAIKAPEPLKLTKRTRRQSSTSTSTSKISEALDNDGRHTGMQEPVIVDSPTTVAADENGVVELDVPLITVSVPATASPFPHATKDTLSPTHAVRVVSFASPPHPARHDVESQSSKAHAALHARPGTPFVTSEMIRKEMEEYERECASDGEESDGEE